MDAWLLQRFPGKTLEELDGLDWPRLMRALRAGAIDRVEQMLPLYYAGSWEPSQAEWRLIKENDAVSNSWRRLPAA